MSSLIRAGVGAGIGSRTLVGCAWGVSKSIQRQVNNGTLVNRAVRNYSSGPNHSGGPRDYVELNEDSLLVAITILSVIAGGIIGVIIGAVDGFRAGIGNHNPPSIGSRVRWVVDGALTQGSVGVVKGLFWPITIWKTGTGIYHRRKTNKFYADLQKREPFSKLRQSDFKSCASSKQ